MKKLLCVLLAAMLLLCSVAALAEAGSTVTFYLSSMTQGSTTLNPANIGVEMTLVLNADGTGSCDNGDGEQAITWTEIDDTHISIVLPGEEEATEFTLEDGKLTANAGDITMVFGTEKPEAANLGTAVAADDASAFNGTWACAYVDMDGQIVDISAFSDYWTMLFGSSDINVVIDNCAVTVFGGDAVTFTFTDGVMTYAL